MRKLTTEEWIVKAKLVHGNKYNYSKVKYNGSENKVTIICKTHGEFAQIANSHLNGSGCSKCSGHCKEITTEDFVNSVKVIHNNKYDYSKVEYIDSKSKILIICPIHGEFLQIANSHKCGRGCDKCARVFKASENHMNKPKSSKQFIKEAKNIHKNKYDYSKIAYVGANKKVIIICKEHGEFEQIASKHLQGSGCAKCARAKLPQNKPLSTEKFIDKANKVHQNKYIYTNTIYKNALNDVSIKCLSHGVFKINASNHLQGQGCPNCSQYGFNKTKPAILYYLKIVTDNNQILYKIGITNRTVDERFNLTDLSKIEIIKQKLYENGSEALEWETKLKQKYKQYRYKGSDILSSGNTELFTEDIIAMYYTEHNLE